MSSVKVNPGPAENKQEPGSGDAVPAGRRPEDELPRRRRPRIVPVLITLMAVAAAGVMSWAIWDAYMASPWTRDGRVRAYVIIMAPEVAGRITDLPVKDNQFVHKGDDLMVIDPTSYAIAVSAAQAQVDQAQANMENKIAEAKRRENLGSLSASVEEKESYRTAAMAATAAYHQAVSALARAKVDLERTHIVSPVNGWVTNLLAQVGDYAEVGQKFVSIIDADSFWVDGYFQETSLGEIHAGDPAQIELMGYGQVLRGHVEGIARGITVENAQAGPGGLATVNPVFTWVRLAQRVPVRIHIDEIPSGVHLVAGQTATVQIEPRRKGR